MIVVLMGVSGSGKTTIGKLLAERTGAIFADADDYHPAANKQKMATGTPLTDSDRAPWLETLNGLVRRWFAEGKSGVLACSALKAVYRDTLVAEMPQGACVCEERRLRPGRDVIGCDHEHRSRRARGSVGERHRVGGCDVDLTRPG